MKQLLLPVLLCTSTLLFAQQKTGSFIKEHLYVKVSPTFYTLILGENLPGSNNNNPLGFAIFGAAGAKMRYAALGFSAGHFKLENGGAVTPLGADLTLTDFKAKVFPAITFQWHQTHFSQYYGAGRSITYISAKDMFSIGAGGAFRVIKNTKGLVTLNVGKLRTDRTNYYSPPYGTTKYNYRDKEYMFFVAASLVL